MTWYNDKLDADFLDHVIQTDYGAALENHRDEILSALKLKELVKESIVKNNKSSKETVVFYSVSDNNWNQWKYKCIVNELQSLVEKSEK